jgi:8-oxo-dGTP pyrophosphatase MutT (NUDIX family)
MSDTSGDPPIASGIAADRVERLTKTIRDQTFPNLKPRDSATLILIDRTESVPKVLLGRRHERHRFMPGKFVFPGGRVELEDRRMSAATALDKRVEARLMREVRYPSPQKSRGFPLAAIREVFEETGLLLGVRREAPLRVPNEAWADFAKSGVHPDLAEVHFIARAVTPPGRTRRFDTRFFAVDATAIAARIEGVVTADTELVELVWLPIEDTMRLDMPGITMAVLEELKIRTAGGFTHDIPVPFYRMQHGKRLREFLE